MASEASFKEVAQPPSERQSRQVFKKAEPTRGKKKEGLLFRKSNKPWDYISSYGVLGGLIEGLICKGAYIDFINGVEKAPRNKL